MGVALEALQFDCTVLDELPVDDGPQHEPRPVRGAVYALCEPTPLPGEREPEPVAVLELYEVRLGEPVDASAFVYKPATEGLIDLTESQLQRLVPLRP